MEQDRAPDAQLLISNEGEHYHNRAGAWSRCDAERRLPTMYPTAYSLKAAD